MYHHVIGAHRATGPVTELVAKGAHHSHHHHILVDSIAAIAVAMLLADCAYEDNGGNGDTFMAMNFTPYTDNCLENDFGC